MTEPRRERFLTARQTAQRFGVGVQTVRRWTRAGKLHAVPTRYGNRYRITDVEAVIAAASAEP